MHRLQEKQEGPVQASANDPDICGLCNSNAIVFNSETNEAVYSKCCLVIQENAETLGAERGITTISKAIANMYASFVSVSRRGAFNIYLIQMWTQTVV
jgi:hypothetical protein